MSTQRKPGRPQREDQPADQVIFVRTTEARKQAYKAAAQSKKLSEWVTEACDKAAGYPPQSQ